MNKETGDNDAFPIVILFHSNVNMTECWDLTCDQAVMFCSSSVDSECFFIVGSTFAL